METCGIAHIQNIRYTQTKRSICLICTYINNREFRTKFIKFVSLKDLESSQFLKNKLGDTSFKINKHA